MQWSYFFLKINPKMTADGIGVTIIGVYFIRDNFDPMKRSRSCSECDGLPVVCVKSQDPHLIA